MTDTPAESEQFLQETDPRLLEAAVAWNHRESFILHTRAAQGEVHEADGVAWTAPGQHSDPVILFPRLAPEHAGEQLDQIVQFYRTRRPRQLVGCWSLEPTVPGDLDIRLLARGFQTGWRPCWMWLDLRQMRTNHAAPEGLRIDVLETAPLWEAPHLPYYNRAAAAISYAAARLQPRRVWHFVAWLHGEPVGQSMLFLTTGPLGVAGIYNVGTVPEARNRRIGKAVTAAACRHAQALGARHALLNATGERMYRQLGFERIGYGWTWWLDVARLEANPPSGQRVALAEAVGRGDLDALAILVQQGQAERLDEPLANGMTLLELAAHARQPASAEWLIGQGAALDLLAAWDLGWTDRVIALLKAHPEAANQRRGEMQITALHAAVERNDHALAKVLLAARPDLTIKDARFGATPLDWARHFRHTEIVTLIEAEIGD